MAELAEEQLRVIFLNDSWNMVVEEQFWTGTTTHVDLRINHIVRKAISLASPAFVIAHNHPSGEARPSTQDIEVTRRISSVCKALQIAVYDHIIVTRNGSFSFRRSGYM
jgi:DNA repair protein RadC